MTGVLRRQITGCGWLAAVVGLVSLASVPPPAGAEVPRLVRYQGQATDTNGVPLQGPYTLTFRLYGAETGGSAVWQETQPNVDLVGGDFSVLLGQVTALDSVDWTKPLWLSIQIQPDPELAPRQRITSVPLALVAERLDGPIQTVGSQIGIGTNSPAAGTTLDVAGKIAEHGAVLLPRGVIVMWSGSAIPAGWALCDGGTYTAPDGAQVTTPDLRDRFVRGVGAGEQPGATGGTTSHAHNGATGGGGEHAHLTPRGIQNNQWLESAAFGTQWLNAQTEISQYFDGAYNNGPQGFNAFLTSTDGQHIHGFTTAADSFLPPWYKVAFIMKL